jgi:putative nucleotidyltransferase with HDIG domain
VLRGLRVFSPVPRLLPDIAVIHDKAVDLDAVAGPLSKFFTLKSQLLDDYVAGEPLNADLHVFFTNPRSGPTFESLKAATELCDGAKIFVLPTHNSDSITKLYNLGINDYVVLPIEPHELRELAKKTLHQQVYSSWALLDPVKQKALTTSLKCFEKCFLHLRRGEPLPIEDITDSCEHIREAAALGGLNEWIDSLDRHHNYSFRHSMFVCGTLTYFAHSIGIRGADLELLTIGGLLHDIGKSKIPFEILDKPGKLDDQEWETMKLHPVYSRTILLNEQNLDKIIVTMATSHHEKLDGTGYPDGLSGSKIDDFVRMTTIADIYSALIDKRAYKGAMNSVEALDVMQLSRDQLDPDLFRIFREYVLDQDEAELAEPQTHVA